MKKKLLTTILLSTVALSQVGTVISVGADSTDDKIAAQDSKIADLSSKEQSAQAEVNQIQSQVSEIKKQQEGIYEVINFESKPEAIAELERIYRITDDIMKYIIVKKG